MTIRDHFLLPLSLKYFFDYYEATLALLDQRQLLKRVSGVPMQAQQPAALRH